MYGMELKGVLKRRPMNEKYFFKNTYSFFVGMQNDFTTKISVKVPQKGTKRSTI